MTYNCNLLAIWVPYLVEDECLAKAAPLGLGGRGGQQVQGYDQRAAGQCCAARVRGPQREHQGGAAQQPQQGGHPVKVLERRPADEECTVLTSLRMFFYDNLVMGRKSFA